MKRLLSSGLLIGTYLLGSQAFCASKAPSTPVLALTAQSISSGSASAAVSSSALAVVEPGTDEVKESLEEKKLAATRDGKKRKHDEEAKDEDEAKRAEKRSREDEKTSDGGDDKGEDKEQQQIDDLIEQIEQAATTFSPQRGNLVVEGDGWLTYNRSGLNQSVFNYKKQAIACYTRAAAVQNIEAMEKLSKCYALGTIVAQDEKKAAEWAKKAKAAMDLEKIVQKARNYQGETGSTQWKKSVALFSDAMKQGSPNAKAGLGYCYVSGRGVEQNWLQGLTLLHTALCEGSVDALYWTASCYYEGLIVGQSPEWRIKLFTMAAKEGSAEAMDFLGRMYRDGSDGCDKNLDEAIKLFTKAAEQGNLRAINDLAFCYLQATGVAEDEKRAVALFNQAIEAGSISALGYLGFCYETGQGVVADEFVAGDYFARGYEGGSGYAANSLGRCFLAGSSGFVANAARAVELFAEAIARGFTKARVDLSYCYRHGLGVTKNENRADEEWKRAVNSLGEEEAVKTVEAIDSLYKRAQPVDEKLPGQNCSSDICTVCQNKIWSGQRASYLVCRHKFHSRCILRWLTGSVGANDPGHTTCPVCRHNVLTECVAE